MEQTLYTDTRLVLQVAVPPHLTAPELAELQRSVGALVREAGVRAHGPVRSAHGWGVEDARHILLRLGRGGHKAQLDVIRKLASNGGSISRAEVYEVTGYPEERSLRGFTRPVRRIFDDMIKRARLGGDAILPLEPVYDRTSESFQQAQGFAMPKALAKVFAEAAQTPLVWRDRRGEMVMPLPRPRKK